MASRAADTHMPHTSPERMVTAGPNKHCMGSKPSHSTLTQIRRRMREHANTRSVYDIFHLRNEKNEEAISSASGMSARPGCSSSLWLRPLAARPCLVQYLPRLGAPRSVRVSLTHRRQVQTSARCLAAPQCLLIRHCQKARGAGKMGRPAAAASIHHSAVCCRGGAGRTGYRSSSHAGRLPSGGRQRAGRP